MKATKFKVNRTIKSVESEDFYYENISKMPYNDVQNFLNSKRSNTDRTWHHANNFGTQEDTMKWELCTCVNELWGSKTRVSRFSVVR